jgi:hypothetical protein
LLISAYEYRAAYVAPRNPHEPSLDPQNSPRKRGSKLLGTPFTVEFLFPYMLCTGIYYWFFARRFLQQDIVLGGDTQLIWSFYYFNIFSLLNFHELAWWDPTALNGWPSYFYATSMYVSYFSPYELPALGLAWISHSLGMSINTFPFYIRRYFHML